VYSSDSSRFSVFFIILIRLILGYLVFTWFRRKQGQRSTPAVKAKWLRVIEFKEEECAR
jgi:hypothetical protein